MALFLNMYTDTLRNQYICVYKYMCVNVHVHICMWSSIYTHTHMYTYTQMNLFKPPRHCLFLICQLHRQRCVKIFYCDGRILCPISFISFCFICFVQRSLELPHTHEMNTISSNAFCLTYIFPYFYSKHSVLLFYSLSVSYLGLIQLNF